MQEKYKDFLKVSLISIAVFFGFWYIGNVRNAISFFLKVISPIMVGLMIAFLVNLPMNFYENKVFGKLKESKQTARLASVLSLILSWITIVLVITILLKVLIPRIVSSFTSLVNEWPDFVNQVTNFVNSNEIGKKYFDDFLDTIDKIDINYFYNTVSSYLKTDGLNLLNTTSTIINNFTQFFVTAFTALVFSFFVLMNKKKLQKGATRLLYAFLNKDWAEYIARVFSLSYNTFSSYIKSKILSSTILGLMIFVGMAILNIPNAAMISVLIGVSDFIPIFGPIVGASISMILIFIESPVKCLIFLVYDLIVQQVQEKAIYPAIAGKQIGLPPIWIMVSITVGAALFGVLGMLIGIPVTSIIYTLVNERIDRQLDKKEISNQMVVDKIRYKKYSKEKKKKDWKQIIQT